MGRQRLVLITLVIIVVGAGLGILAWKFVERHRDLGFTLVFDNANNLHQGQFVVYNGVQIGTVTEVRLRDDNKVSVSVSIDPEHRKKIYSEAVYIIESPTLINVTGEKQVTMKDIGNRRTPVAMGSVIPGTNGSLDELQRRAKEGMDSLRSLIP